MVPSPRRVFAGDAANRHPPAGGQGLNTGIQDAYSLGWRLAHVARGRPDQVLDTYETERRPIASADKWRNTLANFSHNSSAALLSSR
uniref:FAD-dependent monooxygenase n=1 Tax=Caballeronia sp. LjRoot34 TaxID=3342325 RepID=UPI003F4F63D0